jgi:hypothetical protein
VLENIYQTKRLFFPFICIPMKGMILGQTGDKDLKLLAFFRTIMRSAPDEWVETNRIAFQYDNPDSPIGILGEDRFVCHALTSFLHFPLSVEDM